MAGFPDAGRHQILDSRGIFRAANARCTEYEFTLWAYFVEEVSVALEQVI